MAPLALAAAAAAPASALAPPAQALRPRAIAQADEPARASGAVERLRRDARSKATARRFGDAIRDYERLLALAPHDADAVAHLAQLHAWAGSYDKAIVLYRDAIDLHPTDLGLESDLADVLAWTNRFEEAERLYEQVLARDPHHHEALKGLARARLLRGDAASAAAVIDRALGLYPIDVDLHVERARMLSQEGRPDDAIQALQRAAQLAPSDADVLRHLGETYQQKRDWPNALESWLRVAQLVPDDPDSHVALGRVYLAVGKLSLAREHAALALRMRPTSAAANQTITYNQQVTLPPTPIPGFAGTPIYIASYIAPGHQVAERNYRNNYSIGVGFDTAPFTVVAKKPAAMSSDHALKVARSSRSTPSISAMTITGSGPANEATRSKRGCVMVSSSSITFARILGLRSSTACRSEDSSLLRRVSRTSSRNISTSGVSWIPVGSRVSAMSAGAWAC